MRIRAVAGRHPAGILVLAIAAMVAATEAVAFPAGATAVFGTSRIVAVGAESQYADVISQVGGKYIQVSVIMSNPGTDPHEFEASPAVARAVSAAQLVVQNGIGYDTFMSTIESAAPGGDRKVIDAQQLLGLPDSTSNPHLWSKPGTMAKVADAIAADLAALQPAHAGYFQANPRAFGAALDAWYGAMAAFRSPMTPATGRPTGTAGRQLLRRRPDPGWLPAQLRAAAQAPGAPLSA